MRKRFLGFLLSVLMVSGTVDPAVLNAKTTINPQDFINSAFKRPGDDLDTSPTDDEGNPVIKGFDKSLAYASAEKNSEKESVKESTEDPEVISDVPEEATTEKTSKKESKKTSEESKTSTESTEESTEVKTVDKKYWKEGKEHTSFASIARTLNKQLKKKSKDFTINVSIDNGVVKKYRESTFSSSSSNNDKKDSKSSDDAEADPETDERKDAELIRSMALEALFNWNEDEKDEEQDELLTGLLESSMGLTEDEVKDDLANWDVTALAQETKDDEILEGRYYTTLHYEPSYKGEEKSEEKTTESEALAKDSATAQDSPETTEESKESTESTTATESKKTTTKSRKSPKRAANNAPATDVTINFLTAQFISGAKKENNKWVWTPVNSTSDHMFVFRINYSTSGVADVPAGGFKITVPKQILRDRDGNFADFFTMSLPEKSDELDDTDEDTEYAWKTEGDNIVIFNCKEITAAQNGYFDIGYSTSKSTYQYKDMGESEPFFGTLEIDGKTATTDKIPVTINTQATINSTSKYYPDMYRTWQSSWGTKPADADDYYYLVWMIGTNVNNCTQNYNLTLEDNVSSDDGKVELVGYRMSGSSGFSQVNTAKNTHSEGTRYDYVLTRHAKKDFDPLESYKIHNKIKATVDPIDQIDPDTSAVATRDYNWVRPVFQIPTGNFTIWKYGDENWHRWFGYYRDYSSYELSEFKEGKKQSFDNLSYFVWAAGFPAPWTLEKGKYSDDPTAYFKNPVTYTISDDTLYLLDGKDKSLNNEVLDSNNGYEDLEALAKDDYDFSYLTFSMAAKDATYNDDNKDFDTTTHINNDKDILTFWIKVNDEWKTAGTVNLETGKATISDDHVKSFTSDKIEFNPGVKGWKMATTNAYYTTDFYVYPYVNLYRTESVLAKIKDSETILLKNATNLKVTYDKDFDGTEDTEIVSLDRVIGDRIRQIEKNSSLNKRAITSSNNVRKKYYDVGWRVEQSEIMTTGKGEKDYIRQNGGTFYDLLPKGSAFKKGSLSVVTDEGTLKDSQFSYELKADYNQSGRTLLVVRVKPQAKYYNVYYHTQHAWDSIKDYGKDIKNPVAYETGNDSITKGYPDNGGNLSDDNKGLMSGLDQNSTGNKFLYSEDNHWINALTAAISGLDKKVMTAEDNSWSYETFTKPEGEYQYRWRFANNFTSDSKNMIFFDSLENYVVKSGEKSDWHGTLQRIDTSQLESKGINPVVYISEVENLNLDQHHDLTDKTIWKRVDASTDLSKAKAVSIDVRKKTDGTDFVMKSGESVNAVLYMKAPATVQEDLHRYPVTYNNIYIQDTVIDQDGGEFEYFIHQDYTKVKYKITGDFSLEKVSSENADEKIEGIKFKLFGTSDFGTEVNEIKETDQDGHIDFKGIEKGSYTLQEYGSLIDWQEDHTEHKVVVHGDRTVTIDDQLGTITITNKPRIHTDISFLKTDLTKKTKKLKGAKFKLWGTSDYGNEILKYATSQDDGSVKFENVELGTYKLEELEAPEGYVRERDSYTVIVDKSGNFSISNYTKSSATQKITKHSSTSNVSEDGTQNGNYANNLAKTDVVTIPGAKSLKVKIVYSGESASYDWVCAWEGDHADYTAKSNYSSSFTGKLGGGNHTNASNTKEYTVEGDTVTFAFRSDSSGCGDGYGYWAEVVGETNHTFEKVNKYSSSPNVDKDGKQKSDYQQGMTKTDVITIPGAKSLEVTLNYGAQDAGIFVFKGAHPEYTTIPDSPDAPNLVMWFFSGKHTDSDNTETFTVPGDSVTILFYVLSDEEIDDMFGGHLPPGDKYGYWAEISGVCEVGAKNYILDLDKRGNSLFYNEPLHSLRLVKKSSYDGNTIAGAEFTLKGTSDYGTKVDLKAISETNGFIDFKGLEAGTYTLQEVKSPDGFRLDDTKRVVTITKEGEITIFGLAQNKYGNFDVVNQKIPEGQITVIKKWKDKKKPEERTMPTIKISGKKPEIKYEGEATIDHDKWNSAKYKVGLAENFVPSSLNDDAMTLDNNSGFSLLKETTLYSKNLFCKRFPNAIKIDDGTTNKSIYLYKNGDNFYWWSDAERVYLPKDCSLLFKDCKANLLEIDSFKTTKTVDMSGMFSKCENLTALDLSSFNTSNVTTMDGMFASCPNLSHLDLNNFDTDNVTDMNSLFAGCARLTSLDISNFNTSKVIDMSSMFASCKSLATLDLNNFNVEKVTNMGGMFYDCEELVMLKMSSWKTSSLESISIPNEYSNFGMFGNCKSLTLLNLSNFDTSKIIDMCGVFKGCSALTQLDLSSFNTSKVTDMSWMFYECSALTQLDLSSFNTSKVTGMSWIFCGCKSLTQLNLSKFNTSSVITMENMFSGCSKLTQLDLNSFNTSSVTIMENMFNNCSSLTQLVLNNFDTSKVTTMFEMFKDCSSLVSLDLSNFDTSKVTDMQYMFWGCSSLTSLNLSNFDTSNVTSMGRMFCNCSKLASLNLSSFATSNVAVMWEMFKGCSSLVSLDLSNFDTSKVTDMQYMFYNCSSITTLNLSSFNTSKVTDMQHMFHNCSNLASLDLSSFNTSKVTAMFEMFRNCSKLIMIDLSGFDTSQVTNTFAMFADCEKLTNIYVSDKWDMTKVTESGGMFNNCVKLPNYDSGVGSKTDKTVANYGEGGYLTYKASTTASKLKKGLKKTLTAFAQSLRPLQVEAAEAPLAQGTSGTCTWTISAEGELIIKPTNGTEGTLESFSGYSSGPPWSSNNDDIKTVRFEGIVYGGSDCSYMFYMCTNLTSIDFAGFDTSKVVRMESMFSWCMSIKQLNLNSLNTSAVTDMREMFDYCNSITSLDISNFDTSKVTTMRAMFSDCKALTHLNLNCFNVSSVIDMGYMFRGCDSLVQIDFNNFITSEVTNMECMFAYCSNITSLDLNSFDTSKVTTMSQMFYGCSALTSLDLCNFNTSAVTNMENMFEDCSSLTSLNLSSFNTSNVTAMCFDSGGMFKNCSNLIQLDLSNFDTSNVIKMGNMFNCCKSLKTLDLSNFDTSNVTTMCNNYGGMFSYCSSLTSIDLSSFNTSKVTDMSMMFEGCSNLTSIDVSNFDTSNVANMYRMFRRCSNLTALDLSNFNTSKVTDMTGMFSECSSFTSLNLSNFDTSRVTRMCYVYFGMFQGCSNLTSLDLSSFDTSKVTDMSNMFKDCSKLSTLKLGKNFKSLSKTNLPTPSPTGTEDGQYTGKWTKGTPFNHADAITASKLMDTFYGVTMADTWYWEKNGQDPAEQTYTSISDRVFSPADFTPTDDMTQEQKDALAAARDNLLAQYQTEDKDGNAGYWTHIDDNTDMYTFYVYDANINWNIWEEDIEGDYNTNHDITNPYVLAADAVDKTAVITNTIPEEDIQDFGSLEITKQVVNWDDTDIEDPREFTFKVTITDADGKALAQPTTFGDVAFTNGKTTITLKDNETVEMGGIPADYHYKVEEETPNGYTVTMTGQEGDITKDTKTTVLAVNKKDKPKEETPKYVDLTLAKRLTGNYEEKTGEYVMHLSFSALAQSTTYKLSNGNDFTSDDYGNSDVEVTIKPDQKVVVKDLPVGAKYTITEEKGDYFSSYTITDSNQLGKINKSKDSNTEKNKALSTSQETADDGESATVTFTNRIQDTQDLKLTKKVVNAKGIEIPDNGQYEVSIHFENMVPESSFNSSLGPIQADDEGVVDLTTYLKAGDEVNFSQVPVGTRYSFTESANDKTASYTIEDINKLGKINQAKGENTTPQKDLATSSETVNKGEEATVTFYNAKATQGSIKLIKKDGSQKLEGVTFALAQEDGTTVATKTTDANGEVLFEDLDEGVYIVKETKTVKGHSLLSEPFKVTIPFTIKKDKATEKKVDVSKATLVGDTYYFYDLTYTIDNGKNLNLPKTGQDTQSYLLVTLAMAAIVGTQCWIVTSKKRKGILGSGRGKHNKA